MLYLDYSRKEGEWIPNEHGGRENLDAVDFLQRFNREVYALNTGVQTIAEESTSWPAVSRPTYVGGLGFGLKWDMGWMHDTLAYMRYDPIYRKYHQNQLTFRMIYAFHENFVLPLSHDEVVYGKGSLLGKMPGDGWQKFANLRLLFAYMYAQPAKKILFMGGEFGQTSEWTHEGSLDWHLLQLTRIAAFSSVSPISIVAYRNERALHELDCESFGFEWIDGSDAEQSTISFLRKSQRNEQVIAIICNFTPVPASITGLACRAAGDWRKSQHRFRSLWRRRYG